VFISLNRNDLMRKFGSVYNSLVKLLVLIVLPVTLWGQSYTAKYVSVGGNSNGHYVYLPAGYNDAANANKKYPVILFIHGIGELGNGTGDIYKVNNTGLPQYINQGRFPSSFTVNGSQFQFIVVCPQFVNWPSAGNIDAFYDYILNNYRGDASRLYLTGLSMGGGSIWDYAGTSTTNSGRVAAILPICGATSPSTEKSKNMAATNLPVWATHNDGDGTVYVGNTHGFVDGINSFNPAIRAQKTIFYVYGHDAWSKTYDPAYKLTGTLNAYEWMLQYTRGGAYQPPPPPPTPMSVWIDKKTDVTCKSWNNGTATAALTGGVYPYSYTWNSSPVQTGSTATNLPPGTYTVTVKDAAGTTATASATIYEPQALVLSVTPGTITNNGGTTNVTLSASGGTAPYTFTGPTTNVKAGTYTYEVKDSRGCAATKTITITEPAPTSSNLVLWINSTTQVTCNGASDGTATVSTSGGAAPLTYSWNTNPVQTTATATKLPAGTWVVTVKDALGVTGTATAYITQPDKLVLSVSPGSITTNGGTTYVTVSASGGTAPYSFTGPTSNVKAGTYTYTVKDSRGCTDTKTITISEPAPSNTTSNLAAWISNNTPPCFGMNNGSSTVTTFGGVAPITYSWNTNPVQTNATATNLAPGTYTVTVKDATGKSLTATAYIADLPKLVLNVSAGTISTYGGSTSVTISATGGSAPYSFTGPTTDVKAGTYTYTVKDAYGCTDSKTITITEPAPPTNFVVAISSTDVTCWGWATGSAKANPTGGVAPYTYLWNTGQTSSMIGSLKAGSYSVTVKDATGATSTASVVVKEPQRLLLEVSAGTISEYGGSTFVTLSATGGNSGYQFTGPTSNVKAGTYTYSVTDAQGCMDQKTIVITQPAPAVLTAQISGSTNVSCNGGDDGTAYVTVSGGVAPYTYTWNTNPVQTNAAAASLKAGTYTVNVKDANNSVATATVTISEPPKLELLITPGTIAAYGGTTNVVLTATGGTGPYNFSGQKENLPAGTYTYDVVDSKGCTDFETITITQPAPPALTATIKGENAGCNGGNNGSATVTVTGGIAPYSYSWDTDPVQTGATATGLKAGTYQVTVTDALNSKISATVTISEPAKLQLTVTPGTIATYGGTTSVSVSAIGGTEPYVFSGATADLKAGTYNYEVKDAAGCTDTKSVTIADATPPQLTAKASGTNVSCNGANNGSATASAAGGVAPYQYSWNTDPAQTGASVSGLKAGTYIVTVTDALNATTTATVNISEPAKLSLTAVAGTIASYGGTTDVALTATGGSVPYDFTGVTSNLKAGTYSFEVKDAAGCKEVTTLTITQPAPQALTAIITDNKNISCNGAANGAATVTAAGGVAPYRYSWNTIPAQTGTTASELKAGTYMVTVTDALNATATATVKISEPSLLALTAAASGIPANGGTTDVVLNATGGTAPYVYSGQTTGLAAGSYTYSVTDAAGCNATTTLLIGQPDKLNLTAVAGTIKCNGGTTDVVLTATGGKPPYEFSGNTKDLKAGVYNFTVTDAAGAKSNATIQIKDPAALELVVNPGAIKRVGGTTFVDINARGGTMPYTFTGEVSNLRAGTYTYLVTDANSCTATQSVEIKEPKVSLAAFDVGTVDTTVRINWKTSYEYAIDHFTVEKSTDGSSFNPIGAVNSRWSAATLFDYIMNDARPSPAKNVYRIAAVTIYGEKLILQEKSIMFAEHAKITLKNLAERLEVNISSNLEENINFTLFDMNGKALKSIQARKDVYSLRTTIDMQFLPRGTYVLRILSPTIKSSKQVIRL
jgi:large repetitive protein